MCFQVDNKSSHTAQCVKSRVLKKVIDSILYINTFDQQCVVIKCLLQSSRLEDHMKTIGIDQSSFERTSFEHRYMNNIKKIYQHAGKCDDQQSFKDIIDAANYLLQRESQIIVPTFIWHQNQQKNQVLGNHCVYSQTYWMLDLQQRNVVLWLQNQDANPWKYAIAFWQKKRKGHSKINEQIKRNMYTWITRHP